MGKKSRRASRRAARARRAATVPRSPRRRLRFVAVIATIVVAAGVVVWSVRSRLGAPPPSPPGPSFHTSPDGVRVATIDLDALTAWCRDRGLPDPPGVREADPILAAELLGALERAATERGAEALGRVGQIAQGLDSHGAAEEYFRLAAAADEGDYRWPYYLGCVHQETGRRDAAVEAFERALAMEPGYPAVYARLGQLHLDAGRLDDAAAMFSRYGEIRPDDWFGAVGLGRIALRRDDPAAALELLQRAAELGPDDFQVNYHLARAYAAVGDRERARTHFARGEEAPQGAWFRMRDPLVEEMHRAGSSVANLQADFERLSATGDWAALARLGEEIVRRRPADVKMLGNLAGLYRKQGRFDAAHGALDRAARFGTDEIRLHDLRAEVYLAQNDFASAVTATDRALALSQEDPRAHGVRARALYMLERYSEAERSMRRSLELDPANDSNRLVLGEILIVLGETEAAANVYREILRRQPGHEFARQRLAGLEAE